MKRIISRILLPFLFSVITISCSEYTNGFSVSKRHYRDGYNIELFLKKRAEMKMQENAALFVQHTNENESKMEVVQTRIDITTNQSIENNSEPPVYIDRNKNKRLNKINLPEFSGSQIAESGKKFYAVKKGAVAVDESDDSVVWTLISIFIVVWLIALLTGGWGLGGLIYIFLVIALILLLLKLIDTI